MSYISKYSGKEVDERLSKVDTIPKSLSQLTNDVGYVNKDEVEDIQEDVDNIEKQVSDLSGKIDGLNKGFIWIDV